MGHNAYVYTAAGGRAYVANGNEPRKLLRRNELRRFSRTPGYPSLRRPTFI